MNRYTITAFGTGPPPFGRQVAQYGQLLSHEQQSSVLLQHRIQISVDGQGRCKDNVFVERLWRSLKYEEVYLKGYQRVPEVRASVGTYFRFCNQKRPHQVLGYLIPRQFLTLCQQQRKEATCH